MKKNIRITFLSVALPALFMLLLAGGCKKDSDPPEPEPQPSEFLLKGNVISAETHAAVAYARVYFAGQPTLYTDAGGSWQVNCRTTGNGAFDVRVVADGFGYGFATATIATDAAMVNTIMLKPLASAVPIGSQGGTFTLGDPESFIPGSNTSLVIPAGAFTGSTGVSFTRFTGVDVPGYAPASLLNLCTVNIGPAGTVAARPMVLSFALPFSIAGVDNLPLLRYNAETSSWVNTGSLAQVDHATNTATVQVTLFGTYSLAVDGSFTESSGASGNSVTMDLNPQLSWVDFTYQATNLYPGGTPATVSLAYLKNLASQNTRINGARISFTTGTSLTYNYIGTKPDSLAAAKSTATGYYRWVPRVSYAAREMPMTTTIHGVAANGIMQKEVYDGASYWNYVHDQGGGGK